MSCAENNDVNGEIVSSNPRPSSGRRQAPSDEPWPTHNNFSSSGDSPGQSQSAVRATTAVLLCLNRRSVLGVGVTFDLMAKNIELSCCSHLRCLRRAAWNHDCPRMIYPDNRTRLTVKRGLGLGCSLFELPEPQHLTANLLAINRGKGMKRFESNKSYDIFFGAEHDRPTLKNSPASKPSNKKQARSTEP